jgi:hypothetical protein
MKTVHVSDTSKELMRMPCCYYDNNGGGKACDSRVVCTRYKLKATLLQALPQAFSGRKTPGWFPHGAWSRHMHTRHKVRFRNFK